MNKSQNIIREDRSDTPLVSLITVVKNGGANLAEAIDSRVAQNYQNIEYIVVDGLSTDNTLDIIKAHQDVIDYWVSEPDAGLYFAMNKAVKLAKGEIIYFLNADDYLCGPNVVSAVVGRYIKCGRPDIVVGKVQKRHSVYEDVILLNDRKLGFENLKRGTMPSHQGIFMKRELFNSLKGFDTGYRSAADFELLCRCCLKGVNVAYVDDVVAFFRIGGMSSNSVGERELMSIVRHYFGLKAFVFLKIKRIFYQKFIKKILVNTGVLRFFRYCMRLRQ